MPAGMADKSGELSNQANNVHVYADSTDRRALLVIPAATRQLIAWRCWLGV